MSKCTRMALILAPLWFSGPVAVLAARPETGTISAVGKRPPPTGAAATTYHKADGEDYYALSLAPAKALPEAKQHEIVVLFDTSASQVGNYRDKASKCCGPSAASATPAIRFACWLPISRRFR